MTATSPARPGTGGPVDRDREPPVPAALSRALGLPLGVATFLIIGAASSPTVLGGLGWGLLGVFFAAVLPFGLTHRLRRDRARTGPAARRARITYIGVALTTAAAGVLVLAALPAPRPLVAATLTVVVGAVAAGAVNLVWPVSSHTSAASALIMMLVVLYGPVLLPGYLLIAALAWSRIALARHTVAQALAGIGLGSGVALLVMTTLT